MPLEVIQFLYSKYTTAILAKNKHGNLPLHEAAKKCPYSVVSYLLAVHPKGIHERNKEKAIPLHLAAGFSKHVDVIQLLMDAFSNTSAEQTRGSVDKKNTNRNTTRKWWCREK